TMTEVVVAASVSARPSIAPAIATDAKTFRRSATSSRGLRPSQGIAQHESPSRIAAIPKPLDALAGDAGLDVIRSPRAARQTTGLAYSSIRSTCRDASVVTRATRKYQSDQIAAAGSR